MDNARVAMNLVEADKILTDNFAPWVLDLGLSVERLGGRCCGCRGPTGWHGRAVRSPVRR